jgi:hypothetical protein
VRAHRRLALGASLVRNARRKIDPALSDGENTMMLPLYFEMDASSGVVTIVLA